jgi:Mce-associated membrane protein
MSRPTPRRPSSSRAVTPRPRKLAGGRPPAEPGTPAEEPIAEPDGPAEPPPPGDWPVEDPEDDDGGDRLLDSPRVTRMLLLMAAAFALLLVVEAVWYVVREATDDDPAPSRAPAGSIEVPADRPVLPTELAVQEGVEAAAKAAETIINRTFEDYDKEVDKATGLMTDDFAEEYVRTTDDVREQFIARKTTVQARVVGQGVVRANDSELQALLFIDQFVIRKEGKETKTSRTPYRALVTLVNTADGWLVDDVQTE